MLWAEFSVLRFFLPFPVPMLFVQKEKSVNEVTAMPGSVGCAHHSYISSRSLAVNRPEISQPVISADPSDISHSLSMQYHPHQRQSCTVSLFTCKLSFASYLKRFAFIDLMLVSDSLFHFMLSWAIEAAFYCLISLTIFLGYFPPE